MKKSIFIMLNRVDNYKIIQNKLAIWPRFERVKLLLIKNKSLNNRT